ncbi:helix-turn-helix domain-containing protein [Streptomyces cyaneofuscatus]|uniref:helix-turn-helix domain-containing protein n=1 Tax=Streptomyces cyaneofuscatus TaxID=66883 RepID=UPI00365F8487
MPTKTYGSGRDWRPVNDALIELLECRRLERRLTYGQLAVLIKRDSSTVSRALSGRKIPSRAVVQLMARSLHMDEATVMAIRDEAAAIKRESQALRAAGGPPDGMKTHGDFLNALGELIRGANLSQREIGLKSYGELKRSTIGAALRGERSASLSLVMSIVQICEVRHPDAVSAWEKAWYDLAYPDRERRRQRRWEAYSFLRYLRSLPGHRQASAWAMYKARRRCDQTPRSGSGDIR